MDNRGTSDSNRRAFRFAEFWANRPQFAMKSIYVESAILWSLMLYTVVRLYVKVLDDSGDVSSCEDNELLCDVIFWTFVSLACIKLCISVVYYWVGVIVHGTFYARGLFGASLFYDCLILVSTLLSFNDFPLGLYLGPFACSHRLLLNHRYNLTRRAWHRSQIQHIKKESSEQKCSSSSSARASIPYDQITTTMSGFKHLMGGQMQPFFMYSFLDGFLQAGVQTWLVSQLATSATEGDKTNARWQVLVYVITYPSSALIQWLQSNAFGDCVSTAGARLRMRLAASMVSRAAEEQLLYPDSSINSIFSADVARVENLMTALAWNIVAPSMRMACALVYLFFVKPPLLVLTLTILPVIWSYVPQARSSSASSDQAKKNAASNSMFQNGAACQRLIWMCDHQIQWMQERMCPLLLEHWRANVSQYHAASSLTIIATQPVVVFLGLQVAVFAWLAVEGSVTVSEFTAMVALFPIILSPARSFGQLFRVCATNAGNVQRVDEFLAATATVVADTGTATINFKKPIVKPPSADRNTNNCELVLVDVGFSYPNSEVKVLKGVTVKIRSGEFVAIVGESGCGKSTLLSLITTWWQPSEGSLSLNFGDSVVKQVTGATGSKQVSKGMSGFAMKKKSSAHVLKNLRDYRKEMSVVFQDSLIFLGSVHDNIAFGSSVASGRDEVMWAADAAGIADFIATMPKGYDTTLGGKGDVSLSGGQLQRLCIARALCRKPKVLLLDEATSALDPETEEGILQTISSLKSTYPAEFGSLMVVSITHHPDTLKFADVLIRMEDGRVQDVSRTRTGSCSIEVACASRPPTAAI